MYQFTALSNHPEDPEAFDRHYRDVHVPIAKKVPGLNGYYVNWCEAGPDGTPPPYHVIAILTADSKEAMVGGLNSEEGKAAFADLANFASAGVRLCFGEVDSQL